MKKRLTIFTVLLSVILAGCAIKSRNIDIYTFSLPDISIPHIRSKYHNSVLRVDYPNGSNETMGSRIYYREGDKEAWYLYSRWSDSVNRMLMSVIIDTLQKSSIFKDVIDYSSNSVDDYELETSIYDFRHEIDDEQSYAYLKIGFRLLNSENKKIVKHKIFEYRVTCESVDAKGFVKAVKEINNKLARDLINWLKN